jgi:hypothetical protein
MEEKKIDYTDHEAEGFIGVDPTQEIATVETEGQEIFFAADDRRKVFSNLEMDSDLGKAITISCFSGADIPNEDLQKKTFYLQNFLMHTAYMADDNGEKVPVKRCVLIDKDGQTTSFCSDGIIAGVGNLITVYGMGPWEPPIPVKVVERKTRKGFKVKNLVVDISALKDAQELK